MFPYMDFLVIFSYSISKLTLVQSENILNDFNHLKFLQSCFMVQQVSMDIWKESVFCRCWVWCPIFVKSVRHVYHRVQTFHYLFFSVLSVTERGGLNISHINYRFIYFSFSFCFYIIYIKTIFLSTYEFRMIISFGRNITFHLILKTMSLQEISFVWCTLAFVLSLGLLGIFFLSF